MTLRFPTWPAASAQGRAAHLENSVTRASRVEPASAMRRVAICVARAAALAARSWCLEQRLPDQCADLLRRGPSAPQPTFTRAAAGHPHYKKRQWSRKKIPQWDAEQQGDAGTMGRGDPNQALETTPCHVCVPGHGQGGGHLPLHAYLERSNTRSCRRQTSFCLPPRNWVRGSLWTRLDPHAGAA